MTVYTHDIYVHNLPRSWSCIVLYCLGLTLQTWRSWTSLHAVPKSHWSVVGCSSATWRSAAMSEWLQLEQRPGGSLSTLMDHSSPSTSWYCLDITDCFLVHPCINWCWFGVSWWADAPCGAGAPLFPLVHLLPHLFPFLLFPFFPWLYLFSSFVHPSPFYQNSPTPFPGRRS